MSDDKRRVRTYKAKDTEGLQGDYSSDNSTTSPAVYTCLDEYRGKREKKKDRYKRRAKKIRFKSDPHIVSGNQERGIDKNVFLDLLMKFNSSSECDECEKPPSKESNKKTKRCKKCNKEKMPKGFGYEKANPVKRRKETVCRSNCIENDSPGLMVRKKLKNLENLHKPNRCSTECLAEMEALRKIKKKRKKEVCNDKSPPKKYVHKNDISNFMYNNNTNFHESDSSVPQNPTTCLECNTSCPTECFPDCYVPKCPDFNMDCSAFQRRCPVFDLRCPCDLCGVSYNQPTTCNPRKCFNMCTTVCAAPICSPCKKGFQPNQCKPLTCQRSEIVKLCCCSPIFRTVYASKCPETNFCPTQCPIPVCRLPESSCIANYCCPELACRPSKCLEAKCCLSKCPEAKCCPSKCPEKCCPPNCPDIKCCPPKCRF